MTTAAEQELHDFVMDFGVHKGKRLVHVPVGYLLWMVNNKTNHAALADRELARRGSVKPSLDVSGHAIDRASLLCRRLWHEDRLKTGRGLHAWLCAVAAEALTQGEQLPDGKRAWKGMKFTFEHGAAWPVLVTVRPTKEKSLTPEAGVR